MKLLVLAVVGAALVGSASARCPGDCSGKGTCGNYDMCTCYPGYTGGDCSQRVCLYGRAWADAPYGDGLAHDYLECSGNGICDRSTGECQCNDGFVGDACRYSACPNSCNGHGTCEYVEEIAADSSIQYMNHEDTKYNLWDAGKTRKCKCDAGWSGYDCSERMCPKGNDPLTRNTPDGVGANTAEVPEVQTVTIKPHAFETSFGSFTAIGGEFTLTYTDAYNQHWTTRPIRVATKIQGSTDVSADSSSIPDITVSSSVVSDLKGRLNKLFRLYDTVAVQAGTGSVETARISAFNSNNRAMTLVPSGAVSDGDGTTAISITLINGDTGEIGVKRKLMELPNQVIPSVTVDETITSTSNVYRITFSDSANSGDQHLLQCKVGACNTDGCQPRKTAIQGFYEYAVDADFVITGGAGAIANGPDTRALSASNSLVLSKIDASAPVVTHGTFTSRTSATAASTSLADSAATAKGSILSAFIDFTDDSMGQDGYQIGQSDLAAVTYATTNGRNHLTYAGTTGSATPAAGDIIRIHCTAGSHSTNNGIYRIEEFDSGNKVIYLDRNVGAVNSAVGDCHITEVLASPCTVVETRKGTSENIECSGRGNCDTTTGLCACFSGYTDEDCSVQTTLV